MTKEELERIKVAYHSGLKVQIWFNGNWENFDAREYSMYKDPFSENRQYRIVGSDYADMAEKRIAELEYQLTHRNCVDCSNHSSKLRMRNLDLEKENAELKARINNLKDEFKYSENYGKRVQNERHRLVNDNAKLRDQLTKAKYYIKKLIEAIHIWDCKNLEEVEAEAEQFIKDSEVEK